jgi:hypothetical protein
MTIWGNLGNVLLILALLVTSGALVERPDSVSSSARIDSQQYHAHLTLNGSVTFRSLNYEYHGLDCSGILLLSTSPYYISLWNLEPHFNLRMLALNCLIL